MKPEEALVAKLEKARAAASRRWEAKLKAAREALEKVGCTHPLTREYPWEHDNGYGRQTRMVGKQCLLCGKMNLWDRPYSGAWVRDHY